MKYCFFGGAKSTASYGGWGHLSMENVAISQDFQSICLKTRLTCVRLFKAKTSTKVILPMKFSLFSCCFFLISWQGPNWNSGQENLSKGFTKQENMQQFPFPFQSLIFCHLRGPSLRRNVKGQVCKRWTSCNCIWWNRKFDQQIFKTVVTLFLKRFILLILPISTYALMLLYW